jgi:uncharacterized repeat protein (TIGR03803 family)
MLQSAPSQTLSTLHSFARSDGANPIGGLVSASNYLYGTTDSGGVSGDGTVFRLRTDGTGFTTLHHFVRATDGSGPSARLIVSGDTFYGTTSSGGALGGGTVFMISSDGATFTILHGFAPGTGGNSPKGGLLLEGNTLYGTTFGGGEFGSGTVFSLRMDGGEFRTLHSFDSLHDGAFPVAGLALVGGLLYGTTFTGSASSYGTVFAVSVDGKQFTTLCGLVFSWEGGWPYSSLTFANEFLYGANRGGGRWGHGTLFTMDTTGTNAMPLYSFMGGEDGSQPLGAVVVTSNSVFGTTYLGGSSSNGTLFVFDLGETGLHTLHQFSATTGTAATNSDGASPTGDLLLLGRTLYGTTFGGGTSGQGTLFSLSLRPELKFGLDGTNLVLSWPTRVAGFDYSSLRLLSTTNLASPATWMVSATAPTIVEGECVVTNSMSLEREFFCLGQ